jgi:hypothetical protein
MKEHGDERLGDDLRGHSTVESKPNLKAQASFKMLNKPASLPLPFPSLFPPLAVFHHIPLKLILLSI